MIFVKIDSKSSKNNQNSHKPGLIFISIETLVFLRSRQRPFLQFEMDTSSSFNCFADLPMKTHSKIHIFLIAKHFFRFTADFVFFFFHLRKLLFLLKITKYNLRTTKHTIYA